MVVCYINISQFMPSYYNSLNVKEKVLKIGYLPQNCWLIPVRVDQLKANILVLLLEFVLERDMQTMKIKP